MNIIVGLLILLISLSAIFIGVVVAKSKEDEKDLGDVCFSGVCMFFGALFFIYGIAIFVGAPF